MSEKSCATCLHVNETMFGEHCSDCCGIASVFAARSKWEPRKGTSLRGEFAVKAVAFAAIARLSDPKNVKKGSWEETDPSVLLQGVIDEAQELKEAFDEGRPMEDLRSESGDVVASVAIFCDRIGILKHAG